MRQTVCLADTCSEFEWKNYVLLTETLVETLAGGGSSLEPGMRRLLVAGGDDVRRMQAAARVRETQSGLQQANGGKTRDSCFKFFFGYPK